MFIAKILDTYQTFSQCRDLLSLKDYKNFFIETDPIVDEKEIFVGLNLRKVKSKFQ